MALKAHLIVIDPQNDFMDIAACGADPVGLTSPEGTAFRSTLPIPGALKDMERCARLIDRLGSRLTNIHVTLDTHHVIDVAHAGFWRDADGNPPPPFTLIGHDDIKDGIWSPRNDTYRQRMLYYTAALAAAGKFVLMIWPDHCLIGSWGHGVVDVLMPALQRWERTHFTNIDFVTKGTNIFTEHYGALMAEVPDPRDMSTQLNDNVISLIQQADIIGIAGEASSHCVKTTIEQIVGNIGDAHLSKIHILTDCMSPVSPTPNSPDFPAITQSFFNEMQARGLVLTTHDAFLA
jgi:nicotinamidase-related amidase